MLVNAFVSTKLNPQASLRRQVGGLLRHLFNGNCVQSATVTPSLNCLRSFSFLSPFLSSICRATLSNIYFSGQRRSKKKISRTIVFVDMKVGLWQKACDAREKFKEETARES